MKAHKKGTKTSLINEIKKKFQIIINSGPRNVTCGDSQYLTPSDKNL